MFPDVKEIIGVLMRVLGGAEISRAEVMDLGFQAEGELGIALNEAYILLLEFAHDRELILGDPNADCATRAALQASLDKIVTICGREDYFGDARSG